MLKLRYTEYKPQVCARSVFRSQTSMLTLPAEKAVRFLDDIDFLASVDKGENKGRKI